MEGKQNNMEGFFFCRRFHSGHSLYSRHSSGATRQYDLITLQTSLSFLAHGF